MTNMGIFNYEQKKFQGQEKRIYTKWTNQNVVKCFGKRKESKFYTGKSNENALQSLEDDKKSQF